MDLARAGLAARGCDDCGVRALRRSVCGLLGLALICGACSSRPAAPLHVRLDAGPVTAPFDTPVHLTAQFFMNDTGFSLTMRVLAEGHVQTAVTLRREGTPPSSVQTVRQDGFASTLFVPPKVRPGAPAIVVIGGSEGGEDTLTADALALIGYPALALGYFQEPGLPQCLCSVPLEYFARAVGWLRAQPVARGRRVVLIGTSRGAEGALLIASYEPHLFNAVIANSPSYLIYGAYGGPGAAWTFHGKALPTGRTSRWAASASRCCSATAARMRSGTLRDRPRPSSRSYRPPMTPHPTPTSTTRVPGTLRRVRRRTSPTQTSARTETSTGGSERANALAAEQFWAKMITFINDPSAPLT